MKRAIFYRGFFSMLELQWGRQRAECIWKDASERLTVLKREFGDMNLDGRMLILPAAALYRAAPETLPLMKKYAAKIGGKIGRAVHAITSIPGVPRLLWGNMPRLMRHMSAPEKGYERRIISETREMVGVDILVCPLHQAAKRVGAPEVASVVCAMDRAYMTGFRQIEYTRSKALGEGDECCDYRLRFDPEKE